MLRISHALLCAGFLVGIISCRASFQDIQKAGLLSSGDDLGAKDEGADATPDYPILENTKELPAEDSQAYDCDGIVVIHEKGKDKNRDGVLQPTEVTDIKTECKTTGKDPGGKDPGGKDPGQNPGQSVPSKCPNQSNQSKGSSTCDDYDDPKQSGKN